MFAVNVTSNIIYSCMSWVCKVCLSAFKTECIYIFLNPIHNYYLFKHINSEKLSRHQALFTCGIYSERCVSGALGLSDLCRHPGVWVPPRLSAAPACFCYTRVEVMCWALWICFLPSGEGDFPTHCTVFGRGLSWPLRRAVAEKMRCLRWGPIMSIALMD